MAVAAATAANVSPSAGGLAVPLPTVPTSIAGLPVHLQNPPAITLEVESAGAGAPGAGVTASPESKPEVGSALHNAVVYPTEDGHHLSSTPGRPSSSSLTSPSSLGGTPPGADLQMMANGPIGPAATSPVHLPPPGIPGDGGSPGKQVQH